MRIVALLAIRNDEPYLANCLRHLVRNGIDFLIIDNGSSDGSADVYRSPEFSPNLIGVNELAFTGVFSLRAQLERKMDLIRSLEADWIIHLDADEIMHSNVPGETLSEALKRINRQGWDAVNFDEFVFLPIDHDYLPDSQPYPPILNYYFFQPYAPRLIRAWKRAPGVSLVERGGHIPTGSELRLAPEHLVLRHYIFRNQEHAFRKYTGRQFAADEVACGWHRNRLNQPVHAFQFPPARFLRRLSTPEDCQMDRSDPWDLHYWERSDYLLCKPVTISGTPPDNHLANLPLSKGSKLRGDVS